MDPIVTRLVLDEQQAILEQNTSAPCQTIATTNQVSRFQLLVKQAVVRW
jgi:hypothetical protein